VPSRATAALAVVAALVLSPVAGGATRDAGGASIAAAVALPVNSIVVASAPAHAGVQFWKVDLRAGDMLVVVFGYAAGPLNDTGICVLPPSTTDPALAQTHCLATVPDIHWTGGGRTQVVMVAPSPGTYYVAAGLADCLRAAAPDAVKPCDTSPALAYQLGGEVLKFTALRVAVPAHALAKKRVRIAGAVTGADGGTVSIALAGPRRFATRSALAPDGTFAITTRPLPHGRYTLTVDYDGDTAHRPAKRVVSFAVR
jgi:hypothetical protein